MTFTIGLLLGISGGTVAGMYLMYFLIMRTMGRNAEANKENFDRTHKDIMDAWEERNRQADERNGTLVEIRDCLDRMAPDLTMVVTAENKEEETNV